MKHNSFDELPLETWTELFGFVPRSQLIQLVPHIGEETHKTIGDRKFVSFVQFFLHKCGEITFGRLRITSSRNGEPIIFVDGKNPMPLADVPVPENVKDIVSICISNYGDSIVSFLQKFEKKSLLDNMNLSFYRCKDYLSQILTNLLPLFTNINSIEIRSDNSDVLDELQSEYSELATPMFRSTQLLIACYNCRDSWFSHWLLMPREDGKPRILFLDGSQNDRTFFNSNFIKHIKKDFLEANQAASFVIILSFFRNDANVQSLILENGKTLEKLVIKGEIHYVTILRYPVGTNEKEWIEEISQHHPIIILNRTIEFIAY